MNFDKLTIPKHIKKLIDDEITKSNMPVCVRFPPQPSGYLHFGHIFAAKLNQSVAKVYNGKFIVRFDDTNPEQELDEFTDSITQDLNDMGFDLTYVTHTSNSFDLLIEVATQLINLGAAYVDSSTHEEMVKQRKDLVGSKCRDQSLNENLALWQGMIDGSITNMSLRLKAYPDSKNGAMRDPVLYRHVATPHHRTGLTHKIYPTYDFACPILDSVDGVSHIFRSKEYCERDEQMKFILSKLNMRIPKAITYGRLNIENAELSKRKIKHGIDIGLYSGWDDRKLFTYRGMRNRGFSLEGINKILDDVGYPETSNTIQQQKLFTINTKVIDKVSVRLIGINCNDVECLSLDLNTDINKQIPNFSKNNDLGNRTIVLPNKIIVNKAELGELVEGEELTLIYIGNAIFKVPGMLSLHMEGNPSKTKQKMLWLNPANTETVKLEMLNGNIYDYLVEKYIENINVNSYVNLNKLGYFYKKINGDGKIILVEM